MVLNVCAVVNYQGSNGALCNCLFVCQGTRLRLLLPRCLCKTNESGFIFLLFFGGYNDIIWDQKRGYWVKQFKNHCLKLFAYHICYQSVMPVALQTSEDFRYVLGILEIITPTPEEAWLFIEFIISWVYILILGLKITTVCLVSSLFIHNNLVSQE